MMDLRERYARQLALPDFGEAAQKKLEQTSVLLVGAGGLGSAISLYLVAAGIGQITLIDNDTVSESNLQRQVLYTEKQIGMQKVEVAKKRLSELNSQVQISSLRELFCAQNAADLVGNHDIIIDGMDNFEGRYLLNDVCVGLGKTFIYGSIGEYSGQISVFNYQGKATYRCLYPNENTLKAGVQEPPGVLGVLPGVIGCMEASEAIKMITGCGEILAGKLFSINLQNMQTHVFQITRNETEYRKALENFKKLGL